jgi:hypothetical protein
LAPNDDQRCELTTDKGDEEQSACRIASRRMLLNKFSPLTGETPPHRFGTVDGETNQHVRAT